MSGYGKTDLRSSAQMQKVKQQQQARVIQAVQAFVKKKGSNSRVRPRKSILVGVARADGLFGGRSNGI